MDGTIAPQTLMEILRAKGKIRILDVRRPEDYDADAATIAGAEWRDPDRVDEWAASLPRESEVVVFCGRGGSVSRSVVDRLLNMSLSAALIEGGIAAWKSVNGPLMNRPPRPDVTK